MLVYQSVLAFYLVGYFVWSVQQGRVTDWRQVHIKLNWMLNHQVPAVFLHVSGKCKCHESIHVAMSHIQLSIAIHSLLSAALFNLFGYCSKLGCHFTPIWRTQICFFDQCGAIPMWKNIWPTDQNSAQKIAWNNHSCWKTKHPYPILCFSRGKLLPFFFGVSDCQIQNSLLYSRTTKSQSGCSLLVTGRYCHLNILMDLAKKINNSCTRWAPTSCKS